MASSEGSERDLFGKIYTYEEATLAAAAKLEKPDWARDLAVPDHWPQDGTTVDPGKWVAWLPEGWGQGIKPTAGDKTLMCFVSPAGHAPMKRYFHKTKVKEYCEKAGLPGPKEEEKGEKKVRGVHDSVPVWPAEWDLPHDWRLVFKQLPTGLHKCYIPPGQDEGFLYHREDVQAYLTVGKTLAKFATSKPMAQIMAEAAAKEGYKKKKRKVVIARIEDYVEYSSLLISKIPIGSNHKDIVKQVKKSVASRADELVSTAVQLHGLLVARGFPTNTEMLVVCSTGPIGIDEADRVVDQVCGHYYRMNIEQDRPIYQKLQLASTCHSGVACHPLYISWSEGFSGAWKIGSLGEAQAGLAINTDNQSSPQALKAQWRVYSKSL